MKKLLGLKWQIWLIIAAILIIGIVLAIVWLSSNHKTDSQPAITAKFSFADTIGWHLGFSNQTPAVSQVIFSNDGTCFISAEYDHGSIDDNTEVQKLTDSLTNAGDAVASLPNADVSMTIDGQVASYSIYQQGVAASPSSNQQIKGGVGLGFIHLGDHYIKVSTSCDTSSQLSGTVEAVKNISFHS